MTQTIQNKAKLDDQALIHLLEKMWSIRFFEETLERLYKEGEIYGTMHLSIGQEATAVGSASLLKETDWMTSTHRNHGHSLAKGTSMYAMFAEILGRRTGTSGGKGGSMHIADPSVGNLGSNGIVGGGFPIATGAALTAKMQKTDQVVICYSGDGATNEGSFHEALNLAAIWKLPIIYFIENNQYGMSSSIHEMTAIERLSERSLSYGMKGITIEGNHLLRVIDTTYDAIQHVKSGQGPVLIEALTYRHRGHSKSDSGLYRSVEETKAWQDKRDPITQTETLFLARGLLTNDVLLERKQALKTQVEKVAERAKQDPRPETAALFTHVYAE